MCGIIGYKGNKNANKIVLDGLKTLEYRGYDSWGIAVKHNSDIKVFKKTGKLSNFTISEIPLPDSNFAIAHTRWATHGGVTEANAHPHLSMDKKIAVVHNGIVENYQELKEKLKKENYIFISDTDTEVIPNLIQYYIDKESMGFKEATFKAISQLEGSFAIVAIHTDSDSMIAARRGSPLVLGIGDDEYFIASDVPAFLEHTKKVIYLEDDDIAVINSDLTITNKNQRLNRPVKEVTWTLEQAKKGEYPHFMIKEIYEQKESVKKAIEQSPDLIEKATDMINSATGVFFVGCGTSYHACVSTSYVFSKVAHKHVNLVLASEFRNYDHFLTPNVLVVAVSQSGETADLLDAVKVAKNKGCKILSIVNVMGSTLTRLSDENIMMQSGPEICVLSTKSYTSQLAILLLLAYSAAGKLNQGKYLIEKAASLIPKIIDDNKTNMEKLAQKIHQQKDMFLIGRDLAFPSALEGALKIKEVSYIHAEGFAGGELKHGTIALIEKNVPVIVLSTDNTRRLILSNAMEVKARGAYIIGIDSQPNELFDTYIHVPEADDADPILMILPIQLLAYNLALQRGCDPDKPRNLAKSVTVK